MGGALEPAGPEANKTLVAPHKKLLEDNAALSFFGLLYSTVPGTLRMFSRHRALNILNRTGHRHLHHRKHQQERRERHQ